MSRDAGMTVLELLVVLLLLAMVSTLAASQMTIQSDRSADTTALVEDLLLMARTSAVRSGRAAIVHFDTGAASFENRHVSWDVEASGSPVLSRADGTLTDRIIAYPDGSISGPHLLSSAEKGRVLPSPNRRLFQPANTESLP